MGFVATILGHLSPDATSDCLIEVRRDDGLVPFSRADVGALVARARGQLRGVITPGDRVGIIAPNSVHWVASDLAIIAEGGISVPLYYRQAPADLCGMLTDASPTLLLVESETLAESVRSAWSGHSAEACEIRVLADVFEQGGIEIREAPRALQPSDPVTIIYTSGTSGAAKGAVYSASNIDFMLPTTGRALAALCNNETEAQRVFHYLPFCFAGSRIMLWTQLLRPNPLMISTDLTALVDELQLAKPNYYLNVPTVLERIRRGVDDVLNERGGIALSLYRNALEADQRIRSGRGSIKDRVLLKTARNVVFPRIKETIGPNLRFLICGSAPLSAETQQWCELIGIPVYQVYGLTETTGIVTMDKPGEAVAGRVGPAIEGVEVQVNADRQLMTRGPHVFLGYWNRPEATAKVLIDGWFHSGDQAEVDRHGNWKIIGRASNVLVPQSGHNVPPEPIEAALIDACPHIEHAVLIGHGRPYLSVIVTGEVPEHPLQAAIDQVNEALPHYQRIRRFHVSAETFSAENGLLTANGKLRRRPIESRYAADIEEMYL